MEDFEMWLELMIFPVICLLMVGLLFFHASVRSKASLLSWLSFSAFVIWGGLAHWVVDLYIDTTRKPGEAVPIHYMGSYSPHPTFDAVNGTVTAFLGIIFCLSFFLAAVIAPAGRSDLVESSLQKRLAMTNLSTRALWLLSMTALVLSLFATVHWRHQAMVGGDVLYAAFMATVALLALYVGVFLLAVALRRWASR